MCLFQFLCVTRALCFCLVRRCYHLTYADCAHRICSCPSTSYFFFKSDTVSPVYYTTLFSLMLFPHQCLQMYSKGHPTLHFKSKYFKNFSSFESQIYYNSHSKWVTWIKKGNNGGIIKKESQDIDSILKWLITDYSEEHFTLVIHQFFM